MGINALEYEYLMHCAYPDTHKHPFVTRGAAHAAVDEYCREQGYITNMASVTSKGHKALNDYIYENLIGAFIN